MLLMRNSNKNLFLATQSLRKNSNQFAQNQYANASQISTGNLIKKSFANNSQMG